MNGARVSRRRWLSLTAALAGGLAIGCRAPAAPVAERPPVEPAPTSGPVGAAQATATVGAAPAAASDRRSDVLTATLLALPTNLFWGVPNGWSNLSKTDALVGDWLVMPDDEGRLVPRLARVVPTLQNGGARFEGEGAGRRLRVTYRLRDGLVWQDGAPLTSDDVRFAYELQANPELPLIDRSLVSKVEEVQTPDRLTAELVFKPGAFDPDYARAGDVAPRHLWGGIAPAQLLKSELAANPVHAGPYRLEEFRPNEHAIYEANPTYWAGPPRTKTIVLKVAADSNAMFAQARAGQQEITMFGYTGADLLPEIERFAADGRHRVVARPSTSTLIVGLNLDRPHLADVRVRRALLLAMDREGMNRAILHGRVGVLNSWMTPAGPAFVPDLPVPTGGPEAARRLLAEAAGRPGRTVSSRRTASASGSPSGGGPRTASARRSCRRSPAIGAPSESSPRSSCGRPSRCSARRARASSAAATSTRSSGRSARSTRPAATPSGTRARSRARRTP